jgi:hypothetical protein
MLVMAFAYGGSPAGPLFWVEVGRWGVLVILLTRFGLVAATTLTFADALLTNAPLTVDFARWYAWQGVCAVLVLVGLGVFAFWTNLGGRRLLAEED